MEELRDMHREQLEATAQRLQQMAISLTDRVQSVVESAVGLENASLWDRYVDPRADLIGPDGTRWLPLGAAARKLVTSADLANRRDVSRYLIEENEFAINANENRISYVVGWGFTYKIVAKPDMNVSPDVVAAAQSFISDFIKLNKWHARQQEKVSRADRDGEYFLRMFRAGDGILRVRFIEPEHVVDPPGAAPNESFGVRTLPEDVESVLDYYVQPNATGSGDWVPAADVVHVKRNCDSADKRGRPTYWPVRHNLVRAQNLLRNMATVTEIQTAIAMIRKHASAVSSVAQAFVDGLATRRQVGASGKTDNYSQYPPGSVLDVPANVEYEFPAQGIDPSKSVSALQAVLRAIASRLVMPEFMLTSDASNANFASTMVAEGPAVKNFQRLQWSEVEADRRVFETALAHAEQSGLLPAGTTEQVHLEIEPPTVQVRDGLKEAQTAQIYLGQRILSPQTASTQIGLDYEQEQSNLRAHDEASGGVLSTDRPQLPPAGLDPNADPAAGV